MPDTEAFTAGGWLRTGDIGLLTGDGLLKIVDRKKNLILRGGENLSATEIEGILQAQSSCRDRTSPVPEATRLAVLWFPGSGLQAAAPGQRYLFSATRR